VRSRDLTGAEKFTGSSEKNPDETRTKFCLLRFFDFSYTKIVKVYNNFFFETRTIFDFFHPGFVRVFSGENRLFKDLNAWFKDLNA
jgi:hypothetical protein